MDSEQLALDASAFYAGVPFGTSEARTSYVTTPSIYDEISHIKSRHGALVALAAAGRLSVMEPAPDSLDAARNAASRTGDMPNLSGPDITIIALCMERKMRLVTDDYAVSNVMHSLRLGVVPVMTGGIRREVHWQYYCPGCGLVRQDGGGSDNRDAFCDDAMSSDAAPADASHIVTDQRQGGRRARGGAKKTTSASGTDRAGLRSGRGLGHGRARGAIECPVCGTVLRRRPIRTKRAGASHLQ